MNQDLEAAELNRLKMQVGTLQRLLAQKRAPKVTSQQPSAEAIARAVAESEAEAREHVIARQAAVEVGNHFWRPVVVGFRFRFRFRFRGTLQKDFY